MMPSDMFDRLTAMADLLDAVLLTDSIPELGVHVEIHAGRDIEDVTDWIAAFFTHPEMVQIDRMEVHS